MTVVNSKEFAMNQNKYYNLAVNDDVFIKRGKNMFHLMCTNDDSTTLKKRVYYEPDEDFYRSITIDELKEKAHEFIHKMFANNESSSITGNR